MRRRRRVDLSAGIPNRQPGAVVQVEPPPPRGHRQTLWRFLVVGCANATIDAGIYLLLVAAGLPIVASNLISTSCGLLFSFFVNRSFTFRARPSDRRSAAAQLGLFLLVVGFGLWVIQPLVIVAATSIVESLAGVPAWIPDWVLRAGPKVAAIGGALVWNYAMLNWVVFRRPGAATPEHPRTE